MRTIMRLGTLVLATYAGLWLITQDNVLRDYTTGGLTAWITFVPGMLLLLFAVYYAIELFNGWNKPKGATRTKIDVYSAAFFHWNANRPLRRKRRQQDRAIEKRHNLRDQMAFADSLGRR